MWNLGKTIREQLMSNCPELQKKHLERLIQVEFSNNDGYACYCSCVRRSSKFIYVGYFGLDLWMDANLRFFWGIKVVIYYFAVLVSFLSTEELERVCYETSLLTKFCEYSNLVFPALVVLSDRGLSLSGYCGRTHHRTQSLTKTLLGGFYLQLPGQFYTRSIPPGYE